MKFDLTIFFSFTLVTYISAVFMMTTSAAVDPTLGDEIDVGNWICVLVVTQCNDIPLCPSSFKEKDVVTLCVGVGQEHPEGVLKLSDTKVVLRFICEPEMMAAMHCLNAATIWLGKPIILCSLPLKGM